MICFFLMFVFNASFILTSCGVQVLALGSLLIKSKSDQDSFASNMDEQSYILKDLLNSTFAWDSTLNFQLQDLYNHFEVQLDDCEVSILFWLIF